MKNTSHKYAKGLTVLLLTLLFACSPSNQSLGERESKSQGSSQLKASASAGSSDNRHSSDAISAADPNTLPVRFQTPSYTIAENTKVVDDFGADDDFEVKVGADISSTTGPVLLRDIMKKLAALKKMNISWASDVDQYSYVDVDIRADDDFFKSIDNMLRQRDYYHEVQGNTLVIKYKETKRFHLAMPFMASTYSKSVGSDISDNTTMSVSSVDNKFDIWNNIKLNLDKILQIWSKRTSVEATGGVEGDKTAINSQASNEEATEAATSNANKIKASQSASEQAGLGFYTIDEPVGIITVTAPRYQLEKISEYIDTLKKEIYRQIKIEAKILEVTVSGERKVGIDWDNLLKDGLFQGVPVIGFSSASQPFGASSARSFKINAPQFNMLVSAIEKHGKAKVVSNPKLSVMNGQPAIINVGRNETYIKEVTSTVTDTGTSYSIKTGETSSGIVMSVIANIMENNEIILNLTPVTSLIESIKTANFGLATVGLPIVNVKEMTTLVRVKDGEMLVIGGLISSTNSDDDQNVPFLGRIPIIGKLFSLEDKSKTTTELVILLKPEIIS